MQPVIRLTLTVILTALSSGAVFAATPAPTAPVKQAEYKRTDTSYYFRDSVKAVDPSAIILPELSFKQQGDSYFFTPKKKAPKEIYVETVHEWVEPITPPNMPASLGVPSDAIQIREPQGDVQVAYPTAPTTFLPTQDGMTIANGTVIKTGGNGTAAVVFGGVASARLVPNSEAAVQQTLAPQLRTTEIDLTRGAVFSKVGTPLGEKEDYTVHTPFGVAAARGTDFVSVAMPSRMDVWIAQGTVQLNQVNGNMVGSVSSAGTGALQIIRYPVMTDPHQAMMANAETMTIAMNFIPMANQKIKALRDQMAQGVKMTPEQTKYLSLIKKVPCLIKLALVEPPPAPAPVTPPPAPKPAPRTTAVAVPTPMPSSPSTEPLPSPAVTKPVVAKPAAPGAPAPAVTTPAATSSTTAATSTAPAPLEINLLTNGSVEFLATTLTLDELQVKLQAAAKTTPNQPIVIRGGEKAGKQQVHKVVAICHAAKFNKITYARANATQPSASVTPAPPVTAPVTSEPLPEPPAPRAPWAPVVTAPTPTPPASKPVGTTATPIVPAPKPVASAPAPTSSPKPVVKAAPPTPPAASPKPVVAASPPATPGTPKPVAAAAAPTPASVLSPIDVDLRTDGKVDFQGDTFSLEELKPKLEEIAKTTPTQPLVIKGREKVAHEQVHKVVALCHAAKLSRVTVAKTDPLPPSVSSASPVSSPSVKPAAVIPPAPVVAPAPLVPPAPAVPQVPATQIP